MSAAFIRLNLIAILLLLCANPVWAADGFVSIDSHEPLLEYCIDKDLRVTGQLSLQTDNTPKHIESSSAYCDGRKTSFSPAVTLPMSRSTHASLSYRIDDQDEVFIRKVESFYITGWTQVGKILNYSFKVKTDTLAPGQHTLTVIFRDVFGSSCYRYKYGWGYLSHNLGNIIDQASFSFFVPDPESGLCDSLNPAKKRKNLGIPGLAGLMQAQESEAD